MLTIECVLTKLEMFRESVTASLHEIEELDGACKSLIQVNLCSNESPKPEYMLKIQAVIDYMYEKINIGNWKEVKHFIRKTITIASYLKLLAFISNSKEVTEDLVKEAFKTIDFGILFGCPLDREPKLLQNCASIISSLNHHEITAVENKTSLAGQNRGPNDPTDATKYNANLIKTIDCPSMENFLKNHMLTNQPVVVDNCINHWPALQKWKDQNYFINLAGHRTVSIELGSKYTDTDWTQKLMTVKEFITKHIYQSIGPTGYLAQYQLFDQIPELNNDIVEPEYCCFSDSNDPVDVMAWYGPKGTVSPLHHDPKRNLLAQVVGEKQIFLFAPTDSEFLYPHDHELLSNTAQVDPREPDLEKYPKYKDAQAYYCVLKPGQMLFIPPKWWHFVESLSVSFSVSFWWE